MKHILTSFILSLLLHIGALAAITTIQLMNHPPKKNMKILFIKPVKLSEIKALEKKQPVPKPLEKPKPVEKKAETRTKKISAKPLPSPTPTPKVVITPKPEKTPDNKKSPSSEETVKIAILRKQPYFKNWSEERLKKLKLPPGMKSWNEAVKLTEYFDKEYNWTFTPPQLGAPSPNPDSTPESNPYESISPTPETSVTPSPVPWKEYKEVPEARNYEIRFYKDKTGFIATFKEEEKIIEISYFPFELEKEKTSAEIPVEEVEIKIPEGLKEEEIKHFSIEIPEIYFQEKSDAEKDKKNKDGLIQQILLKYEEIKKSEEEVRSDS